MQWAGCDEQGRSRQGGHAGQGWYGYGWVRERVSEGGRAGRSRQAAGDGRAVAALTDGWGQPAGGSRRAPSRQGRWLPHAAACGERTPLDAPLTRPPIPPAHPPARPSRPAARSPASLRRRRRPTRMSCRGSSNARNVSHLGGGGGGGQRRSVGSAWEGGRWGAGGRDAAGRATRGAGGMAGAWAVRSPQQLHPITPSAHQVGSKPRRGRHQGATRAGWRSWLAWRTHHTPHITHHTQQLQLQLPLRAR